MVGSRNDNGVDIIGRQQFLIGSVTLRSLTESTVRPFAVDVGGSQYSRFAIYIEDIAYAGYFDIQIVLLQELQDGSAKPAARISCLPRIPKPIIPIRIFFPSGWAGII